MLHNTNIRPTQANLILLNCISISLFHYSLLDLTITLGFLSATKTESAKSKLEWIDLVCSLKSTGILGHDGHPFPNKTEITL